MPDLDQLGVCATNACRRDATVRLRKGIVTLTLCKGHARIYRSLGYRPVGADAEHTPRGQNDA